MTTIDRIHAALVDCDLDAPHGLDNVIGHRVEQTRQNDEALAPTVTVATFEPTEYSDAIACATKIRRMPGAWATVDSIYSCGCTSVARRPGEKSPYAGRLALPYGWEVTS